MKKQTYNKFIQRVNDILISKVTLEAYCSEHSIPIEWFSSTFQKIYDAYYVDKTLRWGDFDTANRIWTELGARSIPSVASAAQDTLLFEEFTEDGTTQTSETTPKVDEEADCEKNKIWYERDNGKIVNYHFQIAIQDRPPLVGKLSREEMNTIYRMYSYYGLGLTQRDVSRHFPEYSLVNFKRILRAFNITKACSPFAPHMIEEHNEEELVEMTLRVKEDKFLARIEAERIKNNEKLLDKYAQKALDLEKKYNDRNDILSNLSVPVLPPLTLSKVKSEETLLIYLSDMHIGARVDSNSLFGNEYNEITVRSRLERVIKAVGTHNYKEIVVINLGDSLDGMDMQTCRRDHLLPQNMTNKEQLQSFISVMLWFMHSLAQFTQSLRYTCVGESNHDGDFGWAANVALGSYLESEGIDVYISDKFIHHIEIDGVTVICAHGKDNKDMKKNWPLVVDTKTESFILDYIQYNKITGPCLVVKGDLHQSATTYSKYFKYKAVGSLFGASDWVQKNFGNTRWSCDYSVVRNGSWMDGRVSDVDM